MDRIDIQSSAGGALRDLAAEYAGRLGHYRRRIAARPAQPRRLAGVGIHGNAQMSTRLTRRHCRLAPEGLRLLETAMDRLKLSARAYGRILKIARTIADLEGAEAIGLSHLSEAIGYRSLDRGLA